MPVPMSGPSGKVTQGTADVALLFIEGWNADVKQDQVVLGPFLNDGGNLYRARTAKQLTWSFKGVVPSGKDASQTAILTALTAGNDTKISLSSYAGYSIVVALALVENVKLGHDGKGTAVFEASGTDNGGFTIV